MKPRQCLQSIVGPVWAFTVSGRLPVYVLLVLTVELHWRPLNRIYWYLKRTASDFAETVYWFCGVHAQYKPCFPWLIDDEVTAFYTYATAIAALSAAIITYIRRRQT